MSNYFLPDNSQKRERQIITILGENILNSEHVNRLKEVSFLGIINNHLKVPEFLKFSRYDHCISVAYLNYMYCVNLKLSEEITLISTLALLLHDLTHSPFSHSSEIYLAIRAKSRVDHHTSISTSILERTIIEGYESFPNILKSIKPKDLSIQILQLLTDSEMRVKYEPCLQHIIDSPFCADTFDGVNRAWYVLNNPLVSPLLQKNSVGLDQNIFSFQPINPEQLIQYVSMIPKKPYTIRSKNGPTDANLIKKFHKLMSTLYENIIYSDWQISSQVMFSRAEELTYTKKDFSPTKTRDKKVISDIINNPIGNQILTRIYLGGPFFTLSKVDPILYEKTIDKIKQLKIQKKNKWEIKEEIELFVGYELKINPAFVFLYVHKKLVWSWENIFFKEIPLLGINGKMSEWFLHWDSCEGEYSDQDVTDVYFTK